MNAEEHAAEAERLYGSSDWVNYTIPTSSALGALVHAVLALRPDPLLVTPAAVQIGEAVEAPAPLAEGELPTLPGAVVRATVDGLRGLLCRMPDSPTDSIAWRWGSDGWCADDELSDVEVLFPGVPS